MIFYFMRKQRSERLRLHRLSLGGKKLFRDESALPAVTTQIPLYNEANVAERIIRAAAGMEYPKSKHDIQILDDSTDETIKEVDRVVKELQDKGYNISVSRRSIRTGFKAGALREGMAQAKGEYIAIFDSDFVPPSDYLKRVVPILHGQANLGFVQARWGHLNSRHSLLTRSQTLGIDGHFMIEQCARAYNKLFLNFNGTAGIWRKQAILDAGNWQDDTLTEDMDLSYRCQLAGWEATYMPDVIVPAELPESYAAFKNQQFRWAKGSIQTAIKLLPAVMRSRASFVAKLQSFLHMTHYAIHPMMSLMALLALPILLSVEISIPLWLTIVMGLGIVLAMLGPSSMYLVSQVFQGKEHARCTFFLPILVCIGVGIALSNTRAVIEAVLGINSGFVRTPKKGSLLKQYMPKVGILPVIEIIFGAYCAYSMFIYMHAGKYLVGPFLFIYAVGFIWVGWCSLSELNLRPRTRRSFLAA